MTPNSIEEPPLAEDRCPTQAVAQDIENRTIPKRKKVTSTLNSVKKRRAVKADPHNGHCFLTNRPMPIRSCRLVAGDIKPETHTKLEYVWGKEYRQFCLDTKYNIIHLRRDWQTSFNNSGWFLIPEYEELQKLFKIYLEDGNLRCDTKKLYGKRAYRYHVLAAPSFDEPICHYPIVDDYKHETHLAPYENLAPLEGHFHPHFVIFNTGRKLARIPQDVVTQMTTSLGQIVDSSDNGAFMMLAIKRLYGKWMEAQVPSHHFNTGGSANTRLPATSEKGRPQVHPPLRRPQVQGSEASWVLYTGEQRRATRPSPASDDDDSSSVSEDTFINDSTDWNRYIHEWREQNTAQRLDSLGVSSDACDKQLADYISERGRTPPAPDTWASWKPIWDGRKRYSSPSASDRSQFSSNDWAVYNHDVYLTGKGHA